MNQRSAPAPQAAANQPSEPRVQIDEEPIPKFGGPTFKDIKPKTYQVLEDQLQNSDAEAGKTS